MTYMQKLCIEISDRSVGSDGNRLATRFFKEVVESLGWRAEPQEFDAIDWIDGGAELRVSDTSFAVKVSPYSLGCDAVGTLLAAASIEELEEQTVKDSILVLHGGIAVEQLMPKSFVFYNPEHHQKIIAALERGEPRAIVCATGRNSALAGGVYPFPLIEDGDFNIPSVYMTEEEGKRLLPYTGKTATLRSKSDRVPGKGFNVVAQKGNAEDGRIVITAHIDAKKGTPGAIDNATGVTTLLLLAAIMADYNGKHAVELVALNGEDYYSVPGQMLYIGKNQSNFHNIILNINIDGAGYREGKSAFSFYDLPEQYENLARSVIDDVYGATVGTQWPQGDHSIFIQNGCPAIAVSSAWFIENMDNQTVTHTPKDNLGIVDNRKVVEAAQTLAYILSSINSDTV